MAIERPRRSSLKTTNLKRLPGRPPLVADRISADRAARFTSSCVVWASYWAMPRSAPCDGVALGRLMHFYHGSPGFGAVTFDGFTIFLAGGFLFGAAATGGPSITTGARRILCTARRSRSTTTCRTRSATSASRSSPVFPPASPTFWK
jgi:hypothetical protein